MELERKHLAPYLPYQVGIKRKGYEDKNLFLLGIEYYDIVHQLGKTPIIFIKPVLRPLSQLTQEIEHNGEKFVPIDKIKSMWGYETFEYQGYINYAHYFKLEDNKPAILHLPYCFIELFLEWHFDIFGLIEKNLAIEL